MPRKVAIIGSALSGNKGAAAMLEAAVEGLSARIPDSTFVLYSMYPDEDRSRNGYANLTVIPAQPFTLGVVINSLALAHRLLPPLRPMIERHSPAIQELRSADLLLDQGGITFSDGREKFLLYNVASILPALMLGLPVVKCAQAVGPFDNWLNRLVAKAFLPRMALIVTRGRITHELAQGLGLTNIIAGADLAFTLEHAGSQEAARQAISATDGGGVVGLSPSVVLENKFNRAGGDYALEMARFAEFLAERGMRIILLPHSARTGTTATHNNDLPLCRRIFQLLSPAAREATDLFDVELSARELRETIALCDVFVTSRFHAMVSGLATGTPTLVIGWSHKYHEVLEMFGAERWAISHADLSQDLLRKRFEEIWSEREDVSRQLRHHLPAVASRSAAQLDEIVKMLA